jgi:hypothetical protein
MWFIFLLIFLKKIKKIYIKENLLCLGNYQIGFHLIFLNVSNIILKIGHKANN